MYVARGPKIQQLPRSTCVSALRLHEGEGGVKRKIKEESFDEILGSEFFDQIRLAQQANNN